MAASSASEPSTLPDEAVRKTVKPSLEALDGLRGVGAICIVLYHFFSGFTPVAADASQYPVYAPEFTSVVTLFFVISGFTLTCVYNNGNAPLNAIDFMKKRVARMAPVYYVSLPPALPSFYVYVTSTAQAVTVGALTLLWAQSIIVPNLNWNTPLWQASAFAFTYPFFPYSLRVMRTWSSLALRRSLIIFMIIDVVVVLGTSFMLPIIGVNIGILHRWAPFRLPQFFSGIATGILAQRGDITYASLKADLITITLAISALIVCPVLVRVHPTFYALGIDTWDAYDTWAEYLVTPLHCLWILALTAPEGGGLTRWALTTPPLRFLGEISYSMYCFHSPVIFLSAWAVVNKGVNYAALPLVKAPNGIYGYFVFPPWAILPLLGVIVIVATAVHYAIEKPCRNFLNRSPALCFRAKPSSDSTEPLVSGSTVVVLTG